jgi:hypothetical protein
VGVRVDAEHLHRHRQLDLVRYHEALGPRWDVEGAIMLELEQHGVARGRAVREVEAHLRLHRLGLPRGLEVHVEDEVGPRIEPPGHVRGLFVGQRPRLPEQEVAVGIEALGLHGQLHPREARLGVEGVAPARGLRPIDEDVGVVGDAPVVEADRQRAHVTRTGHRDR